MARIAAALRTLMAGAIDFAGLFPPARLPLEAAVPEYGRLQADPDAWMLGRFVCPVACLHELASWRSELVGSSRPVAFSVIGSGGASREEFIAHLRADLETIAAFRDRMGPLAVPDVFEVRVPSMAAPRAEETIRHLLAEGFEANEPAAGLVLTPYLELERGSDWQACVTGTVAAIAEWNQREATRDHGGWRPAGFKLRCGGIAAAAFPSTEEVAVALTTCLEKGVPLKATAGLHHPLRRYDSSLNTWMHGFLNVLGAGVLAWTHRLNTACVQEILEDRAAEDFTFDEAGFCWRDRHASLEAIAAGRRHAVTSFGSCSFQDPRDDLRSLGLIR
jgi:hypothetical protein